MDYFRLYGALYVRVDLEEETAEVYETREGRWERQDVYLDEIYLNGQGVRVTEAEVLAAVGVV